LDLDRSIIVNLNTTSSWRIPQIFYYVNARISAQTKLRNVDAIVDVVGIPRLSTLTKIRFARVASRSLKVVQFWNHGKSRRIARRGGLNWSLDIDEGIDLSIYLLGAFERSTVRTYAGILSAGHIVFDIGANCGAHTLHFAQIVGSRGRVLAFEPTNHALERLQSNLRLNPTLLNHVDPHQIALTDSLGADPRTEIYSSWPLNSGQDLHHFHGGKLHSTNGAKFMSLDEFVLQNAVEKLDFIKLDVDGDEPRTISGGIDTLRKFHPTILMEWCPFLFSDPILDASRIQAVLGDLGYRVSIVGNRGIQISSWSLISEILPRRGSVNVLLQ